MLHRIDKLIGMSIGASDGHIGKITDVYFDDRRWAARYLVVETGSWLNERRVLVSPIAVTDIDWQKGVVLVRSTRLQIKDSPSIDTEMPVSRQHEAEYFTYYGYPDYWSGSLLWGASLHPMVPTAVTARAAEWQPEHPAIPGDRHLRSAKEVSGYAIQATDAAIGHLEDFLLDSENWAIRYVVIDTQNWLPGRHVVIPPDWIKRLDWDEQTVHVDVTRSAVEHAAEYDPALDFSRPQEEALYKHHERPRYWL